MNTTTSPVSPMELATALGCSRPVIDQALKEGRIPALRLGRRWFIPRRVVDEILTNGRIPDAKGGGHEA